MRNLLSIFALVFLAACVTKEIPPELRYTKTMGEIKNPATISGFFEKSNTIMISGDISYVSSIDGKIVTADADDWAKVTPLEPGKRRIGIGYRRGARTAQAEILFNAEPGRAYELRHLSPANIFEYQNGSIQEWIVDKSTGKPASDVVNSSIKSLDIYPAILPQ